MTTTKTMIILQRQISSTMTCPTTTSIDRYQVWIVSLILALAAIQIDELFRSTIRGAGLAGDSAILDQVGIPTDIMGADRTTTDADTTEIDMVQDTEGLVVIEDKETGSISCGMKGMASNHQ
jgi:hypothetical protein